MISNTPLNSSIAPTMRVDTNLDGQCHAGDKRQNEIRHRVGLPATQRQQQGLAEAAGNH